ncbi:MAG: spore coat U domain-containing protein [Geminicoccaceae bacterium]|nr:spore coat U domain-containing protein [Geminicoccaceae bacterium]
MARRRIGIAVALLAAAALEARPAVGSTDTGTLTVTATVNSNCSLSGGTLAFGTYTAGQTSDLDVQGAINYVNCPAGTLVFELDNGANASGSQRRMRSGNNFLNYEIFRTSTRNSQWRTGADAVQVQLLQPGNGSVPVYGRIPAGQAVPPGNYSDTVTITLRF